MRKSLEALLFIEAYTVVLTYYILSEVINITYHAISGKEYDRD